MSSIQYVQSNTHALNEKHELGTIIVLVYPFIGGSMILGLYHLAVLIVTPWGPQVLAYGEDGAQSHDVLSWQGVALGAAVKVGKAVRTYAGERLPMPTRHFEESNFRGDDYDVINHNCVDFCWALVEWISMKKYHFIRASIDRLLELRAAYNQGGIIQRITDRIVYGEHLGDVLPEDVKRLEDEFLRSGSCDVVPVIDRDTAMRSDGQAREAASGQGPLTWFVLLALCKREVQACTQRPQLCTSGDFTTWAPSVRAGRLLKEKVFHLLPAAEKGLATQKKPSAAKSMSAKKPASQKGPVTQKKPSAATNVLAKRSAFQKWPATQKKPSASMKLLARKKKK